MLITVYEEPVMLDCSPNLNICACTAVTDQTGASNATYCGGAATLSTQKKKQPKLHERLKTFVTVQCFHFPITGLVRA